MNWSNDMQSVKMVCQNLCHTRIGCLYVIGFFAKSLINKPHGSILNLYSQFSFTGDLMKKDIHPNYRLVVFQDNSAKFSFITRSTVKTRETITWEDGNEYPLYKLDISSASHPFYTGNQKIVDTEGRVERFMKKYQINKK
jgi:large subunit ribosomal protein L31